MSVGRMIDEDRKHLLWRQVDATTWRCSGCWEEVSAPDVASRDYARAWHRLSAVAARLAEPAQQKAPGV